MITTATDAPMDNCLGTRVHGHGGLPDERICLPLELLPARAAFHAQGDL